jgi:hypothetical protein
VKETDVPGVVLANAGVASPVTRPAVMSAAAIFVIRRPARLLIVARFTFPFAMLFIFVPVSPVLPARQARSYGAEVAGRRSGRWRTGSRTGIARPRFRQVTGPVGVAGNKIVRFLIMMGVNVRFVSVRRVGVSAWQEG